jgi:anti-sigma B factor antagonist
MDLRVRTRPDNETTIFELSGEVDMHSAPALRAQLAPQNDDAASSPIIVDLGGVTFIDSSGVGVLVGAFRGRRDAGGALVFCHAQERVRRVLEITGLLGHLPLYETRDAALEALQTKPNSASEVEA